MNKISSKQALIFIGLVNLSLFIFYSNTVMQLFDFWLESYGYSHGLILFPLALGIYFFELYKHPRLNVNYINLYSMTLTIGIVFVWFLADLFNIQFIEFLTFLLLLIFLNLMLISDKLKNTYHLWPLLLIIFALPLWDFLPEILRTIETPIVVFLLNLSFIEAIQDGFLIYIPAGTFLVEHSCSGFNQFVVSIPLAVLYIYSRKLKFSKSYKFIALILLLAMIFNVIRIYIILFAGQVTHMKTHLVTDSHEYLAWLIYGVGVFILFYFTDKRIHKLKNISINEANIDNTEIIIDKNILRNKTIIFMLVLLFGPLLNISYSLVKDTTLINTEKLIENLYWKESSSKISFSPSYARGDIVYEHNLENLFGQSVNLYLNYFVNQEQGREAINGVNNLIAKDKGSILKQGKQIVSLGESGSLRINEFIIKLASGERYIAWQWYYTNGKHLSKGMDARLNNLVGIVKNRPAITNIVISKKIQPSETEPRKLLVLFISDNFDVLSKGLSENKSLSEKEVD